jgi:hypothetical protein
MCKHYCLTFIWESKGNLALDSFFLNTKSCTKIYLTFQNEKKKKKKHEKHKASRKQLVVKGKSEPDLK